MTQIIPLIRERKALIDKITRNRPTPAEFDRLGQLDTSLSGIDVIRVLLDEVDRLNAPNATAPSQNERESHFSDTQKGDA